MITRKKTDIHTLVFSLLVIGGNEITCPSASTRQGYISFPCRSCRYLEKKLKFKDNIIKGLKQM